MNKLGLLSLTALLMSTAVLPAQAGRIKDELKERKFHDAYKDFKTELNNQTGITYDGAVTALAQRASPSGKITPIQMQYYGEANWDMFKSNYGNGSMQFAYTKVRYQGRQADELDQTLGVASDINDYSTNSNYLDQFSYTHQMPGKAKWLSLTVGQFPMYLFDSNPYLSNQQTDFNNLAMSQNGSYSYPSASMGAFATAAPENTDLSFTVGFQDANNTSGEKMKFNTFNDGDYTTFASVTYAPTNSLGKSKYGFMVYNQPSVDNRPEESNGWSLNAAQDIGEKWAVFGRANGTTHSANLKQSYVLGTAYKDPLNRGNSLDKIGFAAAINKVNKGAWDQDDVRSSETVFEAYWDYGISDYLLITPDIQFYVNPALNPDNDYATVYSLRATVLF